MNGYDYRERVANDRDETVAAPVEAKTSSRRSTRSRKPVVADESVGIDANLLPPSLGIAAAPVAPEAEVAAEGGEGEPKPRRRRSTKPTEVQAG